MQCQREATPGRPGIVIHWSGATPLTDITEDVSTCVHALPAPESAYAVGEAPIIIETPNVEFAHTIYRSIRFVVREMARRSKQARAGVRGGDE